MTITIKKREEKKKKNANLVGLWVFLKYIMHIFSSTLSSLDDLGNNRIESPENGSIGRITWWDKNFYPLQKHDKSLSGMQEYKYIYRVVVFNRYLIYHKYCNRQTGAISVEPD